MANLGPLERAIMDALWDAGRPTLRCSAAHTRDEHATQLMLEALASGTDRLPVPARFARSVEMEDALALLDELTRRAEEG